jgi:hypothetical protein
VAPSGSRGQGLEVGDGVFVGIFGMDRFALLKKYFGFADADGLVL